MTEGSGSATSRAEEIQAQIDETFKELDRIRKTLPSITSPAVLEAEERAITKATDKLAALMTALKIQQAVDSDEIKDKADELVESMQGKFKNQGRRIVSIQTSRGEPVKVSAPYFSRKKKRKRKKKKKK